MQTVLAVAAGGAIGAVGRYWFSTLVHTMMGGVYPWGTLAVNVLGSALLGLLVSLMAFTWSPSLELRAFLTVGLLGALTTYSAFSLEVALMVERGQMLQGAGYALLSVVLCVGALVLTMALMRGVLA
jgi:CrcB protein